MKMTRWLFVLLLIFGFSYSSFAAFKTDNTDDYISCASGAGLNAVSTGTIALWVKWVGTGQDACFNGNGCISSRQNNGVFSNHILGLNGSDPATAEIIWIPYSPTVIAVTGATSVGNGTWHHVAIVFTSGAHTLYLDGVSDGTGTTTGSAGDNSSTVLSIGAWIGDGAGYSGSVISDFAVWTVELTADEVLKLAKSRVKRMPLQIRPASLVSYYAIDECGEGATCTNTVANLANVGTFTGTMTNNPTGQAEQGLSYP